MLAGLPPLPFRLFHSGEFVGWPGVTKPFCTHDCSSVSIVTGAQSNALLVPREAVLGTPIPNGQATVVTLDGGRAERKNVRLGLITDQSVEVTSGLADGQIVAIANASGLNNGDAVAPQLRTALAPSGVE